METRQSCGTERLYLCARVYVSVESVVEVTQKGKHSQAKVFVVCVCVCVFVCRLCEEGRGGCTYSGLCMRRAWVNWFELCIEAGRVTAEMWANYGDR